MDPIAGRKGFQTQGLHLASNEISRQRSFVGRSLDSRHISGHKTGQNALNGDSKRSVLDSKILAEFVNKSLSNIFNIGS